MQRLARLAFPVVLALVATAALPAGGGPRPAIDVADVSVVEGDFAVVTLTLSEPSSELIIAEYSTNSRSARADEDFVSPSLGLLLIEPGVTSVQFVVPTLDDTEVEKDEYFVIQVKSRQARGSSARVTIVDND